MTAAGRTDERARLAATLDPVEPDPAVAQLAHRIAARLAVARPRRGADVGPGPGAPVSRPYRGRSDELDLDATLEALVAHPVPEPEDLVVREPVRRRRSVVLLVDVSGSMRGERIRTAAATVGALAARLDRDRLALIAFWSDAAVLTRLGRRRPPARVLDDLLRLPARGLTNVAFPLELAGRELAGEPPRASRVLLLSDCVHNAGPDPRRPAARLPRLDVLLDASGEQDRATAADLARAGRGRLRVVRTYRDVAPAVSALFR